jgi:hypothetical protein
LQEARGDIAVPPQRRAGHKDARIWAGEPADNIVLPQPVQAAGHQIVHEVVAGRDAGKDLVDEALLGFRRHRLEAKTRVPVFRSIHARDNSARPEFKLLLRCNGIRFALR